MFEKDRPYVLASKLATSCFYAAIIAIIVALVLKILLVMIPTRWTFWYWLFNALQKLFFSGFIVAIIVAVVLCLVAFILSIIC